MSEPFYTPPQEPLRDIDHTAYDTLRACVSRFFIIITAIVFGVIIAWIIGVFQGWIPIFFC